MSEKEDWVSGSIVTQWTLLARMIAWITVWELLASTAPAAPATVPLASANQPTTVCVSQILIRYFGTRGPTVLRTTDTAREIAREALAQALEPGADFEAVGRAFEKKYPDILFERSGPFRRGRMETDFEKTAFALQPGQVADWITSTPYGFHIIRRNPTVHCRHILIAYKGASRTVATRTREEARQLAEKIRAEAIQPGADFAALARRFSDAPDKLRGGDVGVFDKGMMIAAFEAAGFALKVGEVSPPVETRFGFHIIQRIE